MRPKHKAGADWMLYFGIVAMIILLVGVISQPASLFQKSLFLIGAIMLTIVAFLNKQWMLFVLQIVISLGAVLAFSGLGEISKFAILMGAALIGIVKLVWSGHFKSDPWNIVCCIGLFMVAAGVATDANAHQLLFGLFLGIGSLLVALYSFVDYYFKKDNIAIIWFILNLVFAINPLLLALSAMKPH